MKPIAEAAAACGVSRMSVYRYIESGKLTRYERRGGRQRVFVDVKQLRRLLEPRPIRLARDASRRRAPP